jgi:hypothetical protein
MGSPLQPQLEDVIMTAALNHFVPSVIPDIVMLILLEQVVCIHRVATGQDSLNKIELNTEWLLSSRRGVSFSPRQLFSTSSYPIFEMHGRALQRGSHQFMRIPAYRSSPMKKRNIPYFKLNGERHKKSRLNLIAFIPTSLPTTKCNKILSWHLCTHSTLLSVISSYITSYPIVKV